MTMLEALQNALAALEAEGYVSGDIHDDLAQAIQRLRTRHPKIAQEEL
jgi:hypothetical protein